MDNITFANQFLNPRKYGNIILDLNPINRLNIFVALGISTFFVNNYWYGFALVLLFFVIAAVAGRLKRYFSVYWKVLLLFGLFLFVIKAAFSPGEHMIFQLAGIHISTESINSALSLISKVLSFSGAIVLFVQTTEWEDFTYALEHAGVPHVVSFVVLSSFQTISDLGKSAQVIMESQKARGIETDGNLVKRAKAYIPVMGPLVLNAISSVEEKSIAMDARAFSAPVAHTHLMELPEVTKSEKAFVVFIDLLLLATIIGRIVIWLL